jgi:putative transposase
MPRRKTEFLADHYYHVYNRGVGAETLFPSPENYLYFIRLLLRNGTRYAVTVVAYCLMPNHYHLLLRPHRDHNGSKLMHSLASSYSQALNQRLQRRGPLFQGRFCAIWVDRDEYLTQVARYIHANPVVAGLVAKAEAWPYSDYAQLIGITNPAQSAGGLVPVWFPTGAAYRGFVEGYVSDAKEARRFERYLIDA